MSARWMKVPSMKKRHEFFRIHRYPFRRHLPVGKNQDRKKVAVLEGSKSAHYKEVARSRTGYRMQKKNFG
jgi:hypothetical protein